MLQEMIKGIIEAAYDNDADMIATPCRCVSPMWRSTRTGVAPGTAPGSTCQLSTNSQLISLAYGHNSSDSAQDGQIIKARKLEDVTAK